MPSNYLFSFVGLDAHAAQQGVVVNSPTGPHAGDSVLSATVISAGGSASVGADVTNNLGPVISIPGAGNISINGNPNTSDTLLLQHGIDLSGAVVLVLMQRP